MKHVITAHCACGKVALELRGAPITSIVCYCDDCQNAARELEAMAAAPKLTEPDGGTAMIVHRKDRVRCVAGQEHLQAHKLKPKSPTRRMVATCCNSAMLLTFDDIRHWVDVYRVRADGALPPLEMCLSTRFKTTEANSHPDLPAYPGYPLRLLRKLLAARIAMMFGV